MTHLTITGRAMIVLRADRDLVSLKLELQKTDGGSNGGRWKAALYSLPYTEERPGPAFRGIAESARLWQRTDGLPARRPFSVKVWASAPRQVYKNWVLVVEPEDPTAQAVDLIVQATPIEENVRLRWLTWMRSRFDPDSERDRVRDTVRFLTDDEVRRWTGFRDRQVFLNVYDRLGGKRLEAAYPGWESADLTDVAERLPNGQYLSVTF